MSFTSYLVQRFDFTHENQFFRKLSTILDSSYRDEPGEHVLIGNLSLDGHQIDAIFVAKGQITVIDFKDYGGTVHFSENNPWRIEDENRQIVYVQGGSRIRNPFQQVRAYRFALAEFLSNNANEILIGLNRSVEWIHTRCVVLFHQRIVFDNTTLPARIIRYFQVADEVSIKNMLRDYYSRELDLSDNEILNILNVLGINHDNLFNPEDAPELVGAPDVEDGIILNMINRLIPEVNGMPPFKRIINYYKTLIEIERYREPTASNLYHFPVNPTQDREVYRIDITASERFHAEFLANRDESFPKNIFVALNVMIGGQDYPLLHTILLNSDVTDATNVHVNLNEFELYGRVLMDLNLGEDIAEELNIAVNSCTNLDEKMNCLTEHLDDVIQLAATLSIGLSTESMYSSQLKSELNKLSKMEDGDFTNQLFKDLVYNRHLEHAVPDLMPDTVLKITDLNESQEKAVKMAFSQPLAVITGPPGTGKTQLILNILANSIVNGHKVLFASKNNKAVDNVKERLDDILDEKYLLRFGSKSQIDNIVKPEINRYLVRKSAGEFEDRSEELTAIRETFNSTQETINSYRDKINSINQRGYEIEQLKNELDNYLSQREEWKSNIESPFKEFFIVENLRIVTKPSELNRSLNKIDRWKNSFFMNLWFNWFHKAAFTSLIESWNNEQAKKIADYIEINSPYIEENKSILDSAKMNLQLLKELKIKSDEINKELVRQEDHIRDVSATIENKERELNEILENRDFYESEFELWEKETSIGKGIEIVNLAVNQRLYNLNQMNVSGYRNYLPANNIWKDVEVIDFTDNTNQFLEDFNAICVTNLSVKNGFPLSEDLFDLLIIDEASQCDVASVLPMALRAKRITVIGDPLQLTHITSVRKFESDYVINELNLGNFKLKYVDKSLYDFCFELAVRSNFETVFLKEHYRCHPQIISFSNDQFYERRLGQSMEVRTTEEDFSYGETGLNWIHVNGFMAENNSNVNRAEVNKCIDLANRLHDQFPDANIGIITPFRHQKEEISRNLPPHLHPNVVVDTVHKFQGDERDIIIFSTVVTDNSPPGKAYFINKNEFLLNVGITRAMSSLYIVGNHAYCKNLYDGNIRTPLASLAQYAENLDRVIYN